MKKVLFYLTGLVIINLYAISVVEAQNIAITDDDGYTADPSAMLDVKSTTKGLLIPRLTTIQRTSIINPAAGLLVFDTDNNSFYFYNGSSWDYITNQSEAIWTKSGNHVFLSEGENKIGVGTSEPVGKLEVKGDVSVDSEDPLFEVINSLGDTVFAVYSQGVRINVSDDQNKAVSNRGGFVVGGFSTIKGYTNEYLRVSPDSVRIYIDDDFVEDKQKGNRGGFAVGGFSTIKGDLTSKYLFVQDDSTRVWTRGEGGFEIRDLETSSTNYLDLTPNNYFIGHESGNLTTPHSPLTQNGIYNNFMGYKAGKGNTSGYNNNFFGYNAGITNSTGFSNNFIGNQAGYYNQSGNNNVFLGEKCGYSNIDGHTNVFIGSNAGFDNTSGSKNVFIGSDVGESNTTGEYNVFLGNQTGAQNLDGGWNVFIGTACGMGNISGTENVYIGTYSGQNSTASGNTYVGALTGWISSGGNNTFLGQRAGWRSGAGTKNVYLGNSAARMNNGGSENVFVGYCAGESNDGNANVMIGNLAGSSMLGSNKLVIHNGLSGNPFIYGEFDNKILHVDGSIGAGISPEEKLHVDGGIRIGNTNNDIAGNIRWTGSDFEGYNGTDWKSLTFEGSSDNLGNHTLETNLILNSFYISNDGDDEGIIIDDNGYVGIGVAAPTANLEIDGTMKLFGNWQMEDYAADRFILTNTDAVDALLTIRTSTSTNRSDLNFADADDVNPGRIQYNHATDEMSFWTSNAQEVTLLANGNLGVGTIAPDKVLHVNGDARVTGDIYYGTGTDIYSKPDFVFEEDYNSDMSINEVERFINKNGHLPWVTSAKNELDGINMTRMSFETLESVENIQMQIIQLQKDIIEFKAEKNEEIEALQKENRELQDRIQQLEK